MFQGSTGVPYGDPASVQGLTNVTITGDVALVSSTSTAQGQFRDRAIASASAELHELTREPDGRKIRAIHWSYRRRRPSR